MYMPTVEIVVARYNESLNWLNEYPFNQFNYIVYNKGDDYRFAKNRVKQIINIKNVGRCDHTYLYHIVEYYKHLADICVFFTGSIGDIPAKKQTAIRILTNIIKSNYTHAYFIGTHHDSVHMAFKDFKLDSHACECQANISKNSETLLYKSVLRPYSRWYYYFFKNTISHWSTFGGIFSIDKRDIIQHPLNRYMSILQTVSTHSNPEAGHYVERSWGVIFYPLIHTIKQYKDPTIVPKARLRKLFNRKNMLGRPGVRIQRGRIQRGRILARRLNRLRRRNNHN